MQRSLLGLATLVLVLAACKTPQDPSYALRGEATSDDPEGLGPEYKGPPGAEAETAGLWNKYCKGDQNDPGSIPVPNYGDPEVDRAAAILSKMNPHSFALYYYINQHYTASRSERPSSVSEMAHDFLVYLCGEFRDRPTMVQAKIRWVHNTNYLPSKGTVRTPFDPRKDPWMQMVAEHYAPYLDFSRRWFYDRQQRTRQKGTVNFGRWTNVDRAIPAQTVCETKYIFAEYITKEKRYPGLEAFERGYKNFEERYCTRDDIDYYFDFRGDGNFKPNSPESNGMIWHANSIALQCKSTTEALRTPKYSGQVLWSKLYGQEKANEMCKEYFRKPFLSRWNGARAGLGAWLLHDNEHDEIFRVSSYNVTVKPNWENPVSRRPHDFDVMGQPGKLRSNWKSGWAESDFAISKINGDSDPEKVQEFVYARLRNAVDRHTDWYASGYVDGLNQRRDRDQAYSPFVASSYEMAESDSFTAPCYTIPCNGDVPARYWKHYMFIFKIHKDNWYTTDKLDQNEMVDFDRHWIDETSFGTTGLAKQEKAFDRLGTALEHELHGILYLHNICSSGRIETESQPCDDSSF